MAGACRRSTQGADARVHAARADQHFTEPPPRYSEASLVKKLEELGIGRPSTYASILAVLRDRDYVRMERNRFVPEDKGRLVTAFLEQFFARYVEYDFTADLEQKLDLVSAGELDWKALLRDFWKDFHAAVGEIGTLRTTEVLEALNEALGPHIFPDKGDGSRPPALPDLRNRAAVAEDRPLWRLHRLLQLSGVPAHAADRRRRSRERRRERRPRAWGRSEDRPERLAEDRPLRSVRRDSRRRQAQARQPAQGLAAGRHGPRQGAAGC